MRTGECATEGCGHSEWSHRLRFNTMTGQHERLGCWRAIEDGADIVRCTCAGFTVPAPREETR